MKAILFPQPGRWAVISLLLLSGLTGYAQCPVANPVTVANTSNSGFGSLRWAITCVNGANPLTNINFSLSGTIQPTSALPAISKTGALVDGTGQEIILDGSSISVGANGLTLAGSNITVQGLYVRDFNGGGNLGHGIFIQNGSNNTVQDNRLANNRVGIGTSTAVSIFSMTGNVVGLDNAGIPFGNTAAGIAIQGSPGGGVVANNAIAHNNGSGISIVGGMVLISNNSIYCNTTSGITRPSPPVPPNITLSTNQLIRGTAAANQVIEVFRHSTAGCAAAPCQGKDFLGTVTTPASGIWSLTLPAGAVNPGDMVTATQTQGGNNTSAFASCKTIMDCSTFVAGIDQINVSCSGGSDGSATATPTSPALTYFWEGGATTSTISNLSAGVYTVTVTNAAGCSDAQTATITEPPVLSLSVSPTNVACNGGMNGTATAAPGGGTPGYTYFWNNGQTTATATGLVAGNYSVTVTDVNGCTIVQNTTIAQPPALSLAIMPTNVACNGGMNGTATAAPGGGTPGYTYFWNNGQTTATATGLVAGNYSVTVTDLNGCTIGQGTTIAQPPALSLAIMPTNVACNGGMNGTATATPGGGTPGYTYFWNNGQTTATATGLLAGNYSVTVTDLNGCTATQGTAVTQPPALSLNVNVTGETGNGTSNGTVTALSGGGAPPYTYSWNPTGNTTFQVTGLAPGTYTVTVIDQNGCSITGSGTVNAFSCAGFQATISKSEVSCFGGSNGSATALPVNGQPNYAFAWSNGQTMATASSLVAGAYSVTITDQAGCITTQLTTITQPTALTLAVASTDESGLNTSDGSANATVLGGTPPITYTWNNGATAAQLLNLAPGLYTVTIIDAQGCMTTGSATVAAGSGSGGCTALPVYAVLAPAQVCGHTTFTLEADDLFPNPAVEYVWFFPNGDTVVTTQPTVEVTATSGAFSGEYFVLRDSAGCRSIPVGGAAVSVLTVDNLSAGNDSLLCSADAVVLKAELPASGTGSWVSLGAATVDNPGGNPTVGRNLQPGPNTFVWQVALGNCLQAGTDTVTYFLEQKPEVKDDRYTLQRAFDVVVMEVLLNDGLGGLADTLLVQVSTPSVGQLELLAGNRRFRYTVPEDFRGTVTFQYAVCPPGTLCKLPCDTATVTIEVRNLPTVPSGLVVGDSGPNGQLTIRGVNGFSRVEMTITDRWGDLVFREMDYTNDMPWLGDYKRMGKAVPGGAYYYYLKAYDNQVQVGTTMTGVIHLFDK